MNLIEQLGGYTVARNELDRIRGLGCSTVTAAYLELELLEHRRQHNIFEVGDKVVYLSGIAPDHNDIYELSKVGKMHHVLKIGVMDYNAKFNHIRHATDEEIKAGHRL